MHCLIHCSYVENFLPAVKAALAALRSKRQANSSSSNIAIASSSQASGCTPAKDSVRDSGALNVAQEKEEEPRGPADLSLDWAVKGEGKLIEDAKRTGAFSNFYWRLKLLY